MFTKAVRKWEKHMGLPEGAWDNLLEITLKDTANSSFWKINVSHIGSQAVDNFKEGV